MDTIPAACEPRMQDFHEVKRKLKQKLVEKGYDGDSIGKMIATIPNTARNKGWRKALSRVNKTINQVTLSAADFRDPEGFTESLHILKQKWPVLENEYLVFQQYCKALRAQAPPAHDDDASTDEEVTDEEVIIRKT